VNLGKTISKEERKAYLKLFRQYQDVFAWSYRDLKTYDTRIIQHTIPLKPEVKPFQQKLRKYHPSLEPLMYQELKKLLDAKIIFQVRHSTWVENLVPVRKKSGEIRLCVDFRNLNRASEKDNYPVPPMEITPADRVWLRYFLSTGWFLRLQPSPGFRGRSFENYLLNQVGNLRL
jgi:hypothetical protein